MVLKHTSFVGWHVASPFSHSSKSTHLLVILFFTYPVAQLKGERSEKNEKQLKNPLDMRHDWSDYSMLSFIGISLSSKFCCLAHVILSSCSSKPSLHLQIYELSVFTQTWSHNLSNRSHIFSKEGKGGKKLTIHQLLSFWLWRLQNKWLFAFNGTNLIINKFLN